MEDRGGGYSRHRAGAPKRVRIVVVGLLALTVLGIAALVLVTLNPWAATAEERLALFTAVALVLTHFHIGGNAATEAMKPIS